MPKGGPDSGARRLAWEILQRVERGGFADVLLGHRLTTSALGQRDQGLATRLVYTTIAWQAYLDHLLLPFSSRPIAELDAPIRVLLRMALAQVVLLSKIPPFAAVNTAVELAKAHRGGGASGFVNAVLRKAIAGWGNVPLPDRSSALAAHLAVRWSHPEWLVEKWLDQLGPEEAERLLEANNREAPTSLRVNRMRATVSSVCDTLVAAGYEPEPSSLCSSAIRLMSAPNAMALPGFTEGLFSMQGEASQLVGHMVAPLPGMRVLDLCAAPGGKTLHAAELMDDRGAVLARDVNSRGIAQIRSSARRLGLSIIDAQVGDAIAWHLRASHEGSFDRVIVDAPCSGLGTLRAHPEVKWRRSPNDIVEMSALQSHILDGAALSVAVGGTLTYSTCTLTREENDDVVTAFLARHPNFERDDPRADLPAAARVLVDVAGALRTFPHKHDIDGFFAVRLKRS